MVHIWLLFGLAACRFLETALALPDDAAQYTLLSQGHYKHELTAVTDELKEAEIIPTVIDNFLPSLLLDVNWSSSDFASLGNTLKPKKLQDEPSITLTRPPTPRDVCYSATNVTYTVTVTDPDAPSRHDPKWSEFLHWIATGLVVSDTTGSSCLSRHTLSLTDLKDLVPCLLDSVK
ncbi:carboxypeptidase Y inhibitor [Cytospora paraplurivora]|uniref:Carboxypeptidase Y inhibitor n=1 Tax=Cytospora paraplurivora TaxID=2898453 RepID=A0AAN9URI6_9PEZI